MAIADTQSPLPPSTVSYGSVDGTPVVSKERIDWLVVLVITAMPVTWISLLQASFMTLEMRHFAGFLVIGVTGLSFVALRDAIVHFKAPWVPLAMLLYMMIIMFSLFNARIYGAGVGIRSLFWVIVAWMVYSRMPTAKTIHIASIAAFVSFVTAIEISAIRVGDDLFVALYDFFTTGSFGVFRYRFIPTIMSAFGSPLEEIESGSAPNSFAGVALHIFLLYIATMGAVGKYKLKPLVTIVVLGLMLALVFAVLSRAVVLMFVLAILIAAAIALTRRRAWIVLALGAIGAMYLGAFVVSGNDIPVVSAIEDRLFEDKGSFHARANQWSYGIEMIQKKPFTGDGVYKIEGVMDIHNLFLGAFVGGGVFTFLVACFYYLSILLPWTRMVLLTILGASPGGGWSPMFMPALMLVAFVRPMLGGGLGELAADGWIMLAVGMSAVHQFSQNLNVARSSPAAMEAARREFPQADGSEPDHKPTPLAT